MPRGSLLWGLVVLGLAACSDADKPAPTGPDFKPAPPPANACNFKTLASLAGDEFFTAERQIAADKITLMENAGANTAGAEAVGYDLLALLGNTVDQGLQRGTPSVGSNFANNVTFCFTTATKTPLSLPIDFGPSVDPSIDGAFAVRGGTSDPADPVLTRLGGSALGVKPSSGGSFGTALGGRTLIYASPNATALVGGLLGTAYDWNTVPKRSTLANRTLVLGICQENAKSLIQEESAIVLFEPVAFLEAATGPGGRKFCPATATVGNARRWWRDPLAFASRILTPEPAFAAALNPGGTGGRAGGFSTFYTVDAQSIALTVLQQPKDGRTNTDITVKVKAAANVVQNGQVVNNAPIEGVGITFSISGNSGSFNVTPPASALKGLTNLAGELSLTFRLDKAGGYTGKFTTDSLVNSDGTTHSYAPVSVFTDLFNLKQQR